MSSRHSSQESSCAVILTFFIIPDCLTVGDERAKLEHNQSSFEWENWKETANQASLHYVELPTLQSWQVYSEHVYTLDKNIMLKGFSLSLLPSCSSSSTQSTGATSTYGTSLSLQTFRMESDLTSPWNKNEKTCHARIKCFVLKLKDKIFFLLSLIYCI